MGQQGGEVLFAVAEVVFEVIALGLEGVVVFVLDLPASPARGDDALHVLVGEGEVGDEGVEVEDFSLVVGHGQFAPVDFEGVVSVGQGDLVGVMGEVLFQPAFGGGDYAVLLGVAVLGDDEFGAQGDGVGDCRGPR